MSFEDPDSSGEAALLDSPESVPVDAPESHLLRRLAPEPDTFKLYRKAQESLLFLSFIMAKGEKRLAALAADKTVTIGKSSFKLCEDFDPRYCLMLVLLGSTKKAIRFDIGRGGKKQSLHRASKTFSPKNAKAVIGDSQNLVWAERF